MSTWAKLVGVVVEDGVSDTTCGGKAQAEGDTGDGAEPDVPVAEERVETVVENRRCDNDREGVEVVDDVVGDTVCGQHGGKRIGCSSKAVVVNGLKGEEAEHASSLESSLDLLDVSIDSVSRRRVSLRRQ